MFVRAHGVLGPTPEVLHAKSESLAGNLEQVTERLEDRQRRRAEAVIRGKDGAGFNVRLGLGVALACGLAGIVCGIFRVEVTWWGWRILSLPAMLMMLVLHALPCWASAGPKLAIISSVLKQLGAQP